MGVPVAPAPTAPVQRAAQLAQPVPRTCAVRARAQPCWACQQALRAVPRRQAQAAARARSGWVPHPQPPAVQQLPLPHRCARLPQPPQAVPPALAALAASPLRDLVCLALAALGAMVWVKLFNLLTARGVLDRKLSRKLVHTTTGPLFLLTWPLFSELDSARYLAAVVPCLNLLRLVLVGSGTVVDASLVRSVSREGDARELLAGPTAYCLVLVAATLFAWRTHPAGLVAVCMMCGGDGLADIVGRRWGRVKLPYNASKSWAGSVAMLLGGWVLSAGFLYLFCCLGFFSCTSPQAALPVLAAVCAVATAVESLPVNQWLDDNLSVPLVAALLSVALLPPGVHAATPLALGALPAAAAHGV